MAHDKQITGHPPTNPAQSSSQDYTKQEVWLSRVYTHHVYTRISKAYNFRFFIYFYKED